MPFKLHDFGAREVSSGELAALGGAAHLLNFRGTDRSSGRVQSSSAEALLVPVFANGHLQREWSLAEIASALRPVRERVGA